MGYYSRLPTIIQANLILFVLATNSLRKIDGQKSMRQSLEFKPKTTVNRKKRFTHLFSNQC